MAVLNIDEVNSLWATECEIDVNNLVAETARIPRLHNTFYRHYVDSNMVGRVLKSDLEILVKDKMSYYSGNMDPLEVKKRGWPVLNLRILKDQVQRHIDTDPEVIALSIKIAARDAATKYLEDIIKQISNRNFQIKNIIDFLKFKNGG